MSLKKNQRFFAAADDLPEASAAKERLSGKDIANLPRIPLCLEKPVAELLFYALPKKPFSV